jgi:hypothetical protein
VRRLRGRHPSGFHQPDLVKRASAKQTFCGFQVSGNTSDEDDSRVIAAGHHLTADEMRGRLITESTLFAPIPSVLQEATLYAHRDDGPYACAAANLLPSMNRNARSNRRRTIRVLLLFHCLKDAPRSGRFRHLVLTVRWPFRPSRPSDC